MKYSKLQNLFKQAEVIAENSKDAQTKVGCLIVHPRTLSVQTTGYNSFISGANDEILPKTRPKKYHFILHSEVNAICQAAARGKSVEGCIAIVTLSPCSNCMRILWNSGIKTIYFKNEYRDFQQQLKMQDLNITVSNVKQYTKLELYVPNERSLGRTIHKKLKKLGRFILGRFRSI